MFMPFVSGTVFWGLRRGDFAEIRSGFGIQIYLLRLRRHWPVDWSDGRPTRRQRLPITIGPLTLLAASRNTSTHPSAWIPNTES